MNQTKTKRDSFEQVVLTFKPTPAMAASSSLAFLGSSELCLPESPSYRLKGLLKVALRRYGLRCVGIDNAKDSKR